MTQQVQWEQRGPATMGDVTEREVLDRLVIARGEVQMQPAALEAIRTGKTHKGDVLATARIAGIMAAKRTAELIPLCHPSLLTKIAVEFAIDEAASRIVITATVRSTGQSGIDMEALTAVSVAALTIYDMAKGRDRGMIISAIQLLEKRGGQTGDWQRER
jgi:cyclic pyranopterin phosphate synthase